MEKQEKVQLNVRIFKNTYNNLIDYVKEHHYMHYKINNIVENAIIDYIEKDIKLLQKNDIK